ncbi:MAG: DUF6383 domain-containing protein [Bacteroidia bacterium]|nr:DUF6383 domain-containing protein [Bacteroidia bacterium]
MKNKYAVKAFMALTLIFSSFNSASAAQLAGWDFRLWTGSGSTHNTTMDALAADLGSQIATAVLTPSKNWANPSGGGYVRFDNTAVDNTATISGISTVGLSQVFVTWAVGSNAPNNTTVVLEYSINGGTSWTQIGASLTMTTNSGAINNFVSDGFTPRELPADARGVAALQIRVRVTAATVSTSRLLFDNISIDDTNPSTGFSKNNADAVNVFASKGAIHILGANGQSVAVYSLTGLKLAQFKSLGSTQAIPVPVPALYIVKVGEKAYKVGM